MLPENIEPTLCRLFLCNFMNNKIVEKYSLDQQDYLDYQLFYASQSPLVIRKRKRMRLLVPITYIILALILWFTKTDYILLTSFLLIALLWFFLYPLWSRRLYTRHYSKFNKEALKGRENNEAEVRIDENEIYSRTNTVETKISWAEIEEINEVPKAFYLKMKSSTSIVIPKNKIRDEKTVREFLQQVSKSKNIKYNYFPNWEWK